MPAARAGGSERSNQAQTILDALKAALRTRGIRYREIGARIGLSEASVKRVLSRGTLSVARLGAICDAVDIELGELVRIAREQRGRPRELSLSQERALAAQPTLMLVFHLLRHGWRADEIVREYALDRPALVRALARLDRLRLIELLPGDKVRLQVPDDFGWRRDGPVRQRYIVRAMSEFLRHGFAAAGEVLSFEVRELSDASSALLQRRLQRLEREFREMAEIDAALPAARRRSAGMMLAMRPWVFSLADSLRRRRERVA